MKPNKTQKSCWEALLLCNRFFFAVPSSCDLLSFHLTNWNISKQNESYCRESVTNFVCGISISLQYPNWLHCCDSIKKFCLCREILMFIKEYWDQLMWCKIGSLRKWVQTGYRMTHNFILCLFYEIARARILNLAQVKTFLWARM